MAFDLSHFFDHIGVVGFPGDGFSDQENKNDQDPKDALIRTIVQKE